MLRMDNSEIEELLKLKIENLRPKLLDLSRRNPLLATKLTPRSNAHIRVVDELPDVLFYKLNNGQEMRLISLPDIEDDPHDEKTELFRDAFANAQLTDSEYLKDMETIDGDADDFLDRKRQIERALRDRLRAELHMPPRTKQADINLMQHARNNGITPSYDLPDPSGDVEEERHTDNNIQTLLLPKDMERKLNNILSKCRTWTQETGINVLHVAYGFLEWSEPNQTDTSYAPLILCSAQMEKKRTREGVEFHITGAGDEPEINTVLAEKMRNDFGIELPPFETASVEDYLKTIAEIAPHHIKWKVRRQIAIGVFPSARMAMYHDIDPKHVDFPTSEIVMSLLVGSNSETASPFAEDYNVDEPLIEQSVPCLVMDADSSQFSTLVDIANGKNLAVEGPPGTGKSQTIVNAIAAALAEGKKVLFVAEKLAALNVVRSRLEAVGLGEFLLPLQAGRSTREQVIHSIRTRVEMRRPDAVQDYNAHIDEYRRTREQLADYIELLTFEFDASGMTVHEILGRSIATRPVLEAIPTEIIEQSDISEVYLNKAGIARLRALGEVVQKASEEALLSKPCWKGTNLTHAERFTVEEACNLAARSAHSFRTLAAARDLLPDYGIDRDADEDSLVSLSKALTSFACLPVTHRALSLALLTKDSPARLAVFIANCDTYAANEKELAQVLAVDTSEVALADIEHLQVICNCHHIETFDLNALHNDLVKSRDRLETLRELANMMTALISVKPEASDWSLTAIGKAFEAIQTAGRETLIYRNPAMNDPSALSILQKLIIVGRELQAERAGLSAQVSMSVDAPVDSLTNAIATLRARGLFAFFSGNYRNAKRLARSLSLTKRFNIQDMLNHLEGLADYRKRERAFLQNPQAAALFGLHFAGVDTDFMPFEKLIEYFAFIQRELAGPELRALRNFLYVADIDELETVPSVPIDKPGYTLASLQRDISVEEVRTAVQEQALEEMKPLLSLLQVPASISPLSLGDLIEKIRNTLELRVLLDEDTSIATLLGDHFAGSLTATETLKHICAWAQRAEPIADQLANVLLNSDPLKAADHIKAVLDANTQLNKNLQSLSEVAQIDTELFTMNGDEIACAVALDKASQDQEGLFAHSTLATALGDLNDTGTQPLVKHLLKAELKVENLATQFEALALRKLARAVYAEHRKKLARYSGSRLDVLRATLARKDREVIKLSQKQLRWKIHAEAKPPYGQGMGKKSTWTQMALIENEINKQQRFISVRDLIQRAGKALLELKPCWMMSPLAVAQYVPKDALNFDLCIIDEASQMPPEAAIGALLRCKQTVIVGDTNQLPPSSFFKKVIDDEEADEDEAVLNESILEMANATFRPARRLRWHYRSRHSGLIKFSNRLVYDNDLIVFPSSNESMARMGVVYRKVNGIYKAGTNANEARTMVDAALEFMRTDPDRSLGIVTLNQKQRDLITEEFEYALSRNRDAQSYIDKWRIQNDGLEEFFIKNLENVQGDERDVIFIGTVYGPEVEGGKVAQRFGPINGLAGKRRLNVLFSRAKEKIITFSSMTAADIIAEEQGNAGAYMLKRWLEYAATGVLEGGSNTMKEPDSDFEVFVMDQIRAMGCEPVAQVGVAGYFIDIGIRHPNWPHGFILGVECDGASYHSTKSARDRDRLRQEVLESLGWHFHRIWSTDWFNDPRRETERLREVITARMQTLKAREAEFITVSTRAESIANIHLSPLDTEPQIDLPMLSSRAQPTVAVKTDASTDKKSVGIGDTVRVRYLTGDCKVLVVKISATKSDVDQGLIHYNAPIAQALLGAEEGEEVEVLNGPYVRTAVVESVTKGPC